MESDVLAERKLGGFVSVPVLRRSSLDINDVLGRIDLKQEIADEIAYAMANGIGLRLVGSVDASEHKRPVLRSISVLPVPAEPEVRRDPKPNLTEEEKEAISIAVGFIEAKASPNGIAPIITATLRALRSRSE